MNQVTLLGRLTKDPEAKEFNDGNKVVNFSIATDESYKNKEGVRIEQAEFHNIVFYAGIAEVVAKYFKKGQRILITGRLHTRTWETTTGDKRYVTEIIGNGFEFIEKAEKSSTTTNQYSPVNDNEEDDDQLPF